MDKLYTVKLTNHALYDIERIYEYISKSLFEPGIAEKLCEEIENRILSLEQFPERCALRKTGIYSNKNYRQLFVKNYTVIFRIDENNKTVIVVAVHYSASQY